MRRTAATTMTLTTKIKDQMTTETMMMEIVTTIVTTTTTVMMTYSVGGGVISAGIITGRIIPSADLDLSPVEETAIVEAAS